MEEYSEFEANIKNVKGSRKSTCTNSYGIVDYYNNYKYMKPDLKKYDIKKSLYKNIIKMVHQKMIESIENYSYCYLLNTGVLNLKTIKIEPKFVDGELKYKAPIDWKTTLQLWYEDEESKRNKTLVRFTGINNYFYRFKFKPNRYLKNSQFFKLKVNRNIKQDVKKLSLENKIIYTGNE